MNIKDIIQIAFRNLIIGKKMIKRIIFGVVFVVMILFCFLMIIESYYEYMRIFNTKGRKDCYYYTEISEQNLSEFQIGNCLDSVEYNTKEFQAKYASILYTIELKNSDVEVNAGNTSIIVDEEKYVARNYYAGKRKIYQNLNSPLSPVELGLYQKDFSIFGDTVIKEKKENYMVGEYPTNPGELMLDTYLLDVYGIPYDDNILGSKISIYAGDERGREIVFENYVISGFFQGDILEERESKTTKDNHLEHIYVNPLMNDMQRYMVSYGSVRYYFNEFSSFIENYKYGKSILQMDFDGVKNIDIKLTGKGMECYQLYWIANNVGILLLLIALVICIIITASIIYILFFYRNRNAKYRSMLDSIGMTKRDSTYIFSIEIGVTVFISSIIGIYLAVIFILVFNVISQNVLNFFVFIDIKTAILAVIGIWVYFALCFWGIMRKNGE